MKFNHYQKTALTHYLQTNQSISIEALAGTGKTTFIVGTSRVLKYPSDSLILAFTNTAKDNLIERIPDFEKRIKTTYSLGFVTLLQEFGNLKVDPLKTFKQLKRYENKLKTFLFSLEGEPCSDKLLAVMNKEIVNLYNLALCHLATNSEDILPLTKNLLSAFGQYAEIQRFKSEIVGDLIKSNLSKPPTSVSLSEMIALPSFFNLQVKKVKELLVDEAQDLSKAQQALIKQCSYTNSQLILVGDTNQAIFGFAGSDTDSFQNMIKMFNYKSFPMPINYRCGTEIVTYANRLGVQIESPTNMHKGLVKEITHTQAFSKCLKTDKETLVISRTLKTLVKFGLALLYEEKTFAFTKNALEDQLLTQVSYYQSKHSFSNFLNVLESDITKAEQNNKAHLHDLLSSLEYFYHHKPPKNYDQFKRSITTFFAYAKTKSNVKLSTIHSAKGLESHTVIHLGYNHLPHTLCTTPEQLLQERNLDYVARTRAIHRYYLVHLK